MHTYIGKKVCCYSFSLFNNCFLLASPLFFVGRTLRSQNTGEDLVARPVGSKNCGEVLFLVKSAIIVIIFMPEKEVWHYVHCTCMGMRKCYCAATTTIYSDYQLKPDDKERLIFEGCIFRESKFVEAKLIENHTTHVPSVDFVGAIFAEMKLQKFSFREIRKIYTPRK